MVGTAAIITAAVLFMAAITVGTAVAVLFVMAAARIVAIIFGTVKDTVFAVGDIHFFPQAFNCFFG